jgi:uncharacterized protein DUF4350
VDLLRSRVALRERALLDVIDLAVGFCAAHARSYAKLSLVVLAPALAASCVVSWAGGWWLGWTATVVMTAFAAAPFTILASRLVFADDVSTREVLGASMRVFAPLVKARALQALALGLSALFLGLPWLWVGTSLLFVVEVLLLEQPAGVGAAFGRARRVAGARFGTALLAMVFLAAAPIAMAMVADIAGREVLGGVLEIRAPPPPMFREGGSWLALCGWYALLPLISTARFFVYLDIRTRAEGWDIQTRFAAIAARANAELRQRTDRAWRPPRAVVLVLALLAVASDAHAAVDPSHAQADVDAAIADHGYSFCRNPVEPLTFRARALCAHASEIPGCEGFVAACARAERWSRWQRGSSATRTLTVPGIVGEVARMAVWLLVLAVATAVLVPVVRAAARMRRPTRATRDDRTAAKADAALHVTTAPDEDELLARAGHLARLGESAAALELYLAASLRALDKRGAVRLSKDRTNGEYARQCAEVSAKLALQTLVRDVDRVKFGGENASADVLSRAAQHAAAIVRALPAALLALALPCAFGCAGVGSRAARVGQDPAGDELWYEVMRRQGIRAERLDSALNSLPTPDDASPAVVVDTERTELDRETRDHLVTWVEAGGTLVLAGAADDWPSAFGLATSRSDAPHELTARRLLRRSSGTDDDDNEESTPAARALYADETQHAKLADDTTLKERTGSVLSNKRDSENFEIEWRKGAERVAWFDDQTTYAAVLPHGKGYVLGIATDELMTNVGLARSGNAAAMIAIFSNADRIELRVAQEDDGVAPPSTPIAALSHAGLGVGLVHALVASLVLFFAVGVRLARPRPSPPPRCRAFAEHVEAVGSLYARARAAPHALAVYTRFAEERLRARMPRGATDVASFLASRAHLPNDVCRRLWARAMAAKAAPLTPLGDELSVLEELSAAYGLAMAEDA